MGESRARTWARSTSGSTASSTGTPTQSSFVFQLFHTSRPGLARHVAGLHRQHQQSAHHERGLQSRPALERAKRWGRRRWRGGGLEQQAVQRLRGRRDRSRSSSRSADTVWTPRVLKDGADSVGALGALNRVYLNIGLFSEEWLLHFNALVGGKRTTPIEIAVARKNSSYWQATEAQTVDMALFFLKSTGAPPPQGRARRSGVPDQRPGRSCTRGKVVFAERCARCHSSKMPAPPASTRTCAAATGAGLPRAAGRATGSGPRRTTTSRGCGEIVLRTISSRTTSSHRVPRAGHAARDQRLQPARHQRDRGTTSGTTSRPRRTRDLPSVGRDHGVPPDHRRADGTRCRPAAGATPARPRSSASGRPRRSC